MAGKDAKPAPKEGKRDDKSPRERFLDVGAKRVGKAIKAIRNVQNISSRKSYDYSEAEALKAVAALRKEVDAVEERFKTALAGKASGGEKDHFSFS